MDKLAELQKVKSLTIAGITDFTDKEYTNIIKPLHEWLIKLQALQVNVTILLRRLHTKELAIIPLYGNTDLTIPKQVKNIYYTTEYIDYDMHRRNIRVQDYNSLIFNDNTYDYLLQALNIGHLHGDAKILVRICEMIIERQNIFEKYNKEFIEICAKIKSYYSPELIKAKEKLSLKKVADLILNEMIEHKDLADGFNRAAFMDNVRTVDRFYTQSSSFNLDEYRVESRIMCVHIRNAISKIMEKANTLKEI